MKVSLKKRVRGMMAVLLSLSMMIPQSSLTVLAEENAYASEETIAEQETDNASAQENESKATVEEEPQETPVEEPAEEPQKTVEEDSQENSAEEPQETVTGETQQESPAEEITQEGDSGEISPDPVIEEPVIEEPKQESDNDNSQPEQEKSAADEAGSTEKTEDTDARIEAEETEETAAGTVFNYEDNMVKIVVEASEAAQIPADAVLHAEYMKPGSEKYLAAVAELDRQLYDRLSRGEEDIEIEYVLYDIYFTSVSVEGRIEPNDRVKVRMEFKTPIENEDISAAEEPAETIDLQVVHLPDNGQAEIVTDHVYTNSDGDVTGMDFFQDTFSPTGLAKVIRKMPTDKNGEKIGVITKASVKNTVSGSEPFDTDAPESGVDGKDKSADDSFVRSYDQITYELEVSVDTTDQGTTRPEGRVGVKVTLPYDEEVYLDKGAMGWAQDWKKDREGENQVYTFYRELPTDNGHAIPGGAEVPVIIYVGGKTQGYQITPTIETWCEGESETHPISDVKQITVTTSPQFNLTLEKGNMSEKNVYDFSDDSIKYNKDAGKVTGYEGEFAVGISMRNENLDKKMRGLELPDTTRDITFDIDLKDLYEKTGEDSWTDISADFTPLLTVFKKNGENNNYVGSLPVNGIENEAVCCEKTGDVTVTQEGTTLHVTIKGGTYACDPEKFPERNSNGKAYKAEDGKYYEGFFSTYYFKVVLPVEKTVTENGNQVVKKLTTIAGTENLSVQLDAKVSNMKVNSVVAGHTATVQSDNSDDEQSFVRNMVGPGGEYNHEIFFSRPDNWTEGTAGSDKSDGSDSITINGKSTYTIIVSEKKVGGADMIKHAIAFDSLVKFDDKAISVDPAISCTVPSGSDNLDSTNRANQEGNWKLKILYAYKPDGSGWSSEEELRGTKEKDLVYSETYDGSKTCVGKLYQWRGCNANTQTSEFSKLAQTGYVIKSDHPREIIAKPYTLVASTSIWRAENYQDEILAYTREVKNNEDLQSADLTLNDYVAYAQAAANWDVFTPEKQLKDEVSKTIDLYTRDETYKKAQYDPVKGYIGKDTAGWLYGDTIYVVPYTMSVSKSILQKTSEGSEKLVYSLDNGQRVADYVIAPSMEFTQPVDLFGEGWTTDVTLTDTLPKGLTYMQGTGCVKDGEYNYVPSEKEARGAGLIQNAESLEPQVTANEDGTTTLTWVLRDIPVQNGRIPNVFYSCMIGDPNNVANDVANGKSLLNTVVVDSKEDHRKHSEQNKNLSTAKLTASKLSSFNLSKTATPEMEADGAGTYDISVNNSGNSAEKDICAIDIMPFHGDASGTIKKGDYELTGMTLDVAAIGGVNNLRDVEIWYTYDEKVIEQARTDKYAIKVEGWLRANLADDGSITDASSGEKLIGGWPTAIAYIDASLPEMKSAHITMSFKGKNGRVGDYLNNSFVMGSKNLSITDDTRVFTRSLEGIAWIDKDRDGVYTAGDVLLNGVTATLYKKTETGDYVQIDAQTTDAQGHYHFGALNANEKNDLVLHEGDYQIRFTTLDGYEIAEKTASDTEDEAGNVSEENKSLADRTTAMITDIHMPSIEEIKHMGTHSSHYNLPHQNIAFQNLVFHRSIEGYAWEDRDKDGIREDDEAPIKGSKKVVLYQIGEDGTAKEYAVTDLDETGHYSFTELPSGTFEVVIREDSYVTVKNAEKAPEGKDSKAENDPQERTKENPVLTGVIKGIILPTDEELASDDYRDKLDENNNYNSPHWDAGFIKDDVHKTEEDPGAGNTVQVGDEVTYEISYYNTHAAEAQVIITDTLDDNVKYLTSSNNGLYDEDTHTVTWTIAKAKAYKKGWVTLTVQVEEGAVKPGKIENTAYVQIGNDAKQTTETIENPADGKVTRSLEGTAWLDENKDGRRDSDEQLLAGKTVRLVDKDGNEVKDVDGNTVSPQTTDDKGHYRFTNLPSGDFKVIFEIDEYVTKKYAENVENGKNSKADNDPAVRTSSDDVLTAVIKDITLPTDEDLKAAGKVSYNLPNQDAGFITFEPHKSEEDPGDGKAVKVGEEICYKITYENLHSDAAVVKITDVLDAGVDFVSATDGGEYTETNRTVTWTIQNVPGYTKDAYVLLTVRVNKDAVVTDGVGEVVNTAAVQVGNDAAQNTETVKNPVPENPVKTALPVGGTSVKAGDEITYTVEYRNYEKENAVVVIEDILDAQVELVSPAANEAEGIKVEDVTADGKGTKKVTWTIADVPAGQSGSVSLTVKVKEGAEKKIDNVADVTVGNEAVFTTNIVTHPIPPVKAETKPGEGKLVQVGEKITYEISYINYHQDPATVTVVDHLDENVKLVSTDPAGVPDETEHTVTWTFENLAPGADGKVSLTVEVEKSAEKPEKVENQATMKVGDDNEIRTDIITNPVEVKFSRSLEGTAWKDIDKNGIREDGDEILKDTPVILMKKDETTGDYEEYRTARTDETGHYSFTALPAGEYQIVFKEDSYVTVKGAEDAPEGKDSKADNAPAERKDENDVLTGVITGITLPTDETLHAEFKKDASERTYALDENNNYNLPYQDAGFIDEEVSKKETDPGADKEVKAGQKITYVISYFNTHSVDTDVTVTDELDPNVKFIEASEGSSYDEKTHTVTWKIEDAAALEKDTVTLTVEVLLSAVVKPRFVENTAVVQIGNDKKQTTETVTNPVNPEFDRTISGTAWFDRNRNGIREDQDELLKDVTVVLYKKDETGTYVKVDGKTAQTDENGYYEFTGLEAGDYQVVFEREQGVTKKSDIPDGHNSIAENLFDKDGDPVSAVITKITLPTDDEIEEMIVKDELKSTTYVKEYQDAGFIKKLTADPGNPSVSLDVTKTLEHTGGNLLLAKSETFYVALFADEGGEERITEVKELLFENESSASVTFDDLLPGETYYVKETDAKGNVMLSGLIDNKVYYADLENDGKVELGQKDAAYSFRNVFEEVPDGFYYVGGLKITKKLADANGNPKKSDQTFRAGIFADSDLTEFAENVSDSIVELDLNGDSSTSVDVEIPVAEGTELTLYVAELGEDDEPVDDSFAYTVTVSKEKILFNTQNLQQTVVITNTEKPAAKPTATPTVTPTATPTPTPKATSAAAPGTPNQQTPVRTADDTPISAYLLMLLIASGIFILLPGLRKRNKKSR